MLAWAYAVLNAHAERKSVLEVNEEGVSEVCVCVGARESVYVESG